VSEASQFKATYDVAYAPGRLLAVGYKDGRAAGRWELRTAGSAARAELAADRPTLAANNTDLAFVSITLVDDAGVPIYRRADDLPVQVDVSGAATLAGLGNGNPIDTASFTSGERRSFHGHVLAVIKAGPRPGPVLVTVRPEGLPAVQLQMTVHNDD
jgi:beta-galactosidase